MLRLVAHSVCRRGRPSGNRSRCEKAGIEKGASAFIHAVKWQGIQKMVDLIFAPLSTIGALRSSPAGETGPIPQPQLQL
jgi:hypothetical protein